MSVLQDRPALPNILATVREFLERGTDTSAAQLRFRAQVSAFLLGVVEREVALGPELDRQASAALASFLGKIASLDELIDELGPAVAEVRELEVRSAAAQRSQVRGVVPMRAPGECALAQKG